MAELAVDIQLKRADFSLRVNEQISLAGITAVFGPSGAGKTMLLRVISGLERDARGRIEFDASIWQNEARFEPAHRRQIGFVFQDGRLFPHLDVAGNLRFAARPQAGSPRVDYADVVDALELQALLKRRTESLSGGERQRVAIGRALLRSPRLLLMDEPLSSLDSARKAEIVRYIEGLPERFKLPIIYVAHDIGEVARLAKHMLLIAAGRVVERGATRDILERIDLWTFTGRPEAGSVLEMQVRSHANGMTELALDEQTLRVPEVTAVPGSRLMLKINARDVVVATRPPEHLSIRNVLQAKIVRIDVDAEIYAELLLDLGSQRLRARVTRDAVQALNLTPGQAVYALIKSVLFEDYARL